ncbi:hypothetical protein BD309DRAFT_1085098 [Dichomitus squalens]|nr:hypothetical protein BD309DRAFT_1085098 [Dichomitus squalens]
MLRLPSASLLPNNVVVRGGLRATGLRDAQKGCKLLLDPMYLQFPIAPAFLDLLPRLLPPPLGCIHVDVLDIVALNARSEIALGQWDDGCTSLAWRLRDSAGSGFERQLLGQNWDWRVGVGKNLAMVSIEQDGKPKIWMVTEPGIVGKIGFNSSSVGVLLNAIRARPISTSLLPIHCLLRMRPRALPAWRRLPPDGIVMHTNHFLENKLVDEPPWLFGSPVRLERADASCGELIRG